MKRITRLIRWKYDDGETAEVVVTDSAGETVKIIEGGDIGTALALADSETVYGVGNWRTGKLEIVSREAWMQP